MSRCSDHPIFLSVSVVNFRSGFCRCHLHSVPKWERDKFPALLKPVNRSYDVAHRSLRRCDMETSVEAIKFDLCCAARALFRAGLSVGVAGHLSVAIGEDRMLMNRFGPSFGALRPADICTFDFHGKVVEHDPLVDPYVNDTIALHAVIHRYNPQISAVGHTHPPATATYGTFRRVPEIYDQESCFLARDIGILYYDDS